MSDSVLQQIRALLAGAGVAYREVEHAPTFTSEESAQARGEALEVGAKALVVRTDEQFRLFVLPAHRKLDSAAVRREFGASRTRFATADELLELTGLVPGSVPPFGEPLLPLPLWADVEVGRAQGRVAFNAGSLTVSIIMSAADWEAVARPKRLAIARP